MGCSEVKHSSYFYVLKIDFFLFPIGQSHIQCYNKIIAETYGREGRTYGKNKKLVGNPAGFYSGRE